MLVGALHRGIFALIMELMAVALYALLWVIYVPKIGWQLLRWLFPEVGTAKKKTVHILDFDLAFIFEKTLQDMVDSSSTSEDCLIFHTSSLYIGKVECALQL